MKSTLRPAAVQDRNNGGMNLTHRLRLPVPPDQAWAAFADPRRLAEALPGASVDPAEPNLEGSGGAGGDGDRVTGTLKVKLGPLALAFDGSLEVEQANEGRRRLVWRTQAVDRRGHGTAQARHAIVLRPAGTSGRQTDVEISTELDLTGRPAQLGRGVVTEAADRLVTRFGTVAAARVAQGRPWLPGSEHGSVPDAGSISIESAGPAALDGGDAPRTVTSSGVVRTLPWVAAGLLVVAVALGLARRGVQPEVRS